MNVPELDLYKVLVLVRRYVVAIFFPLGRLKAQAFECSTLLGNPDGNASKTQRGIT